MPEATARAYLRLADRLLPGFITGFYVVGSAALGEFVPGRSDVDFVAVCADRAGPSAIRRLRLLHIVAGLEASARGAAHGRSVLTGTPNGAFVAAPDLGLPVSQIVPIACHHGRTFEVGRAFEVNPVVWKVFAEQALVVRGPSPEALGLDPEPDSLRAWNLANLNDYWLGVGRRFRDGDPRGRLTWRMVSWIATGPARLHCTITTGRVIGKPTAAGYALDVFGERWRPVLVEAGRYVRRQPVSRRPTRADLRLAAELALEVVQSV